ncbi:MAG TPA: YaiI/YqxD family protein [Myxococcota bacterium]|nr:YaiI/YqxD family protein [Myxococcota bacterium]
MIEIFVDADACPVKDEVYRVAARYAVYVTLVANSRMGVPPGLGVELVIVGRDADAADDWIVAHVRRGDVVVTSDIPLAARCLPLGARVLGTDGRPFTEDSIGNALASRDLHADLRAMGVLSGGPRGVAQKDRSRFLSRLDEMVQAGLREAAGR